MSEDSTYPVLSDFDRAYFIGIGGIGMSALARYFKQLGWDVTGYDKTETPLTIKLVEEGIDIHYSDLDSSIPELYRDSERTIVIITPAVPVKLGELLYFKHNEFTIQKRSEILGMITRTTMGIGVAGTHGKTTTSTMLAHILNESELKCTAFLGGISSNFNSNILISSTSDFTVIEADEFDRSFLRLKPFASIVTSTDPDHLDIYGDSDHFREGFELYAGLTSKNGVLVQRYGLDLVSNAKNITYGINEPDANYWGDNIRAEEGCFLIDIHTPKGIWNSVEIGIPGIHNAENALSCIALCEFLQLEESEIRYGLKTFLGVKRRFEYQIKSQKLTYIDDYAHHPTEIQAFLSSVKMMYPDQKITGVFQPHLFSRTRDFFDRFVKELSLLDEVILLPIYPAREEPIDGVTSEALLEKISSQEKRCLLPNEVIELLSKKTEGIFVTIGAGDIDRIVEPLKRAWS